MNSFDVHLYSLSNSNDNYCDESKTGENNIYFQYINITLKYR